MIGQIQQAKKSKSLKTLSVQINGAWYTSKNWELEQAVGKTVIFEPSTRTFPDGSLIQWLNEYVFEDQQTTPAGQAMDQAMAGRHGLNEQGYPEGSPDQRRNVPRGTPNKDSVIGAMGLCKCCTPGTPDQVFENFRLLYHKLENWDSGIPF
jgi:hypothetical protein